MSIQAKNIRNVVFAGHASKGKTTLCEALLNVAGTTERMGKTADSNTVLDFDSEEKKRKISVNSEEYSNKMKLIHVAFAKVMIFQGLLSPFPVTPHLRAL